MQKLSTSVEIHLNNKRLNPNATSAYDDGLGNQDDELGGAEYGEDFFRVDEDEGEPTNKKLKMTMEGYDNVEDDDLFSEQKRSSATNVSSLVNSILSALGNAGVTQEKTEPKEDYEPTDYPPFLDE